MPGGGEQSISSHPAPDFQLLSSFFSMAPWCDLAPEDDSGVIDFCANPHSIFFTRFFRESTRLSELWAHISIGTDLFVIISEPKYYSVFEGPNCSRKDSRRPNVHCHLNSCICTCLSVCLLTGIPQGGSLELEFEENAEKRRGNSHAHCAKKKKTTRACVRILVTARKTTAVGSNRCFLNRKGRKL